MPVRTVVGKFVGSVPQSTLGSLANNSKQIAQNALIVFI